MCPVCFRIGALTIHWYGVMLAAGFLAGLGTWIWLGRRRGWDFAFCSDLLFWTMVSGIGGGRLAYVLGDLRSYLADPLEILRLDKGGLVYYGGFIGAALGVILFARRRGVRILPLGDLVTTALPLGHALGRVGCFLNGCCFGERAPDGWLLAVAYPPDSPAWYHQWRLGLVPQSSAGHSLPVHPVQLYEASANLLLYALLVAAYRAKLRDGRVAALYFLTYPVVRFSLEFLRGDQRICLLGFSAAQWTSIALLAGGMALWHLADRQTAPGKDVQRCG
jgi:phosphatidylglycerol:prolipoprotein diacylglycerol transferase